MANRLQSETSPYLLQHAGNPVDWWPWCEEALAQARREDKPILLSIGYSACHWCHVMAHESFEDPEVAEVMNRLFINIKVDREERPDLDQIYQTAHQILAQRPGGWPLTLFLAPDGTPFFGGTYFPKSPRHGLPGFVSVLERVGQTWREQRQPLEEQNEDLRAALASAMPRGGAHHSEFSPDILAGLRDLLASAFDERNGGFGDAPKFPHPADLDFLLRHHFATGDEKARDMALLTLKRMAEGGIYDQLGGGFCRYSVDARWQIPHFEKMLYDNGPLLGLYADAWVLTGESLFARVAEETAAWALREMRLPEGAFAASLDADSEGEEGRFYVWDRDELCSLLSDDEYRLLAQHYGVDQPPNFENRHWHLAAAEPLEQAAAALKLSPEEARSRLDSVRAKLLLARGQRVRPGRDDKVLTGWNALMIRGLAHAARIFGRADWRAAAQAATDFIRATLWHEGRLLATCKDGRAHLNAYLDDHAWLLAALLEMMEDEFRSSDLEFAQDIADALVDSFEDTGPGGFFFTRHDHERLVLRPKTGHDTATPSGNGVAAWALGRLGHLTGELRYLDAAERTLQAFYGDMQASPAGYASMAIALAEWLEPPSVVVVRGPTEALLAWRHKLGASFRPSVLALVLDAGASGLPPVLDKPVPYIVNAWVCRGVTCLPAVSDWQSVEALLPEIGKAGHKD